MLRPCESKILNLHLKVKLPERIQGFISILPIFIEQSLILENSKLITSQMWNEPIKIELLNRNFHCTTTINENEENSEIILTTQL